MAWALWAAASQALDASAWQALWSDPQTLRAWGLTLWTGLASTALAWWTVARLLAHGFIRQTLARWLAWLPALLATPHAALAIGLVLWLSPSGWALRLVSPGLSGFDAPPPWLTTQDPWGLGLILALWLKEVPFLLWVAATQLQREDLRRRWQAEFALAQTLGHTPATAFAQVVWPQLAPRLRWPLLAVLAYGLTVVDMALIIGPATPPTLAVLAWQWLGDADAAMQAQGAAAAGWLTFSVVILAGVTVMVLRAWARLRRITISPLLLQGESPWVGLAIGGAYLAVWWALAVGSVSGVWPFPQLWPSLWTGDAWAQVIASAPTVWTTLGLAAASASVCLVWSVAWLELTPRRWQQALRPWWLLPLVLPSVLWVVGLYSVALQWRLEGQWLGLLLAHAVMVLPYVLLALEPAYLAVDPRQSAVVASLGLGRWTDLLRIKWPLLKRAIASAWAVGFAVSVAQYLPTLYVGAGRFATVTTEAVTLASGAQRSLMSAYAALQMLLPVLAFALAAYLGRPRQFEKIGPMKDNT
jgi:putative thiamine transport system permease protein